MNRTCTCGATAPADAQFCPRCGRPLDGAPNEPLTPEVVLPVLTPDASAKPPPIGFGNPQALRSALLASLVAAVLSNLPLVGVLCFIWYPGAGFLSVYNYRRRTGLTPTTSGGAKLGWITGVFTFVISLAMLAVVFLVPQKDGSVIEIIRRQIGDYPAQKVRWSGSFGSAYLYYLVPRVILFRLEHTRRTMVDQVDFISAPGTSPDNVYRQGGPHALITDRCLFAFDRDKQRFRLESVHPGHTLEEVRDNTGFDFEVAQDSSPLPTTPGPDASRLALSRGEIAAAIADPYPKFAAEVLGLEGNLT